MRAFQSLAIRRASSAVSAPCLPIVGLRIGAATVPGAVFQDVGFDAVRCDADAEAWDFFIPHGLRSDRGCAPEMSKPELS